MFSYYGSKSKIIHLYPAPTHDLIIEPFAGSARYALEYFERNVVLIDKFHKIVKIWQYLKQASKRDILTLPDIGYKQKIPASLSGAERWLIGYCVGRGSPRPATMGHKFNDWNKDKKRIADSLFKIRHWEIVLGEYNSVKTKATWFIDPPYTVGGHKYSKSSNHLDFQQLSRWAKELPGQKIVCENGNADWMDFKPIAITNGCFNKTTEVFWTNEKVEHQSSFNFNKSSSYVENGCQQNRRS